MERLLFESAVRALLIAAGTAIALRAFAIKSPAARHKAWTGVIILMLLLPIWTVTGPRVSLPVLQPLPVPTEIPAVRASNWPAATVREPATAIETRQLAEPSKGVSRSWNWQTLLLGIYLMGAFTLLVRLTLGMVQAHRLIHGAVRQNGRLTSESCAAPITIGWLHPVVLLPRAWTEWPRAQLDAVLTHEQEHARQHHPFVQWLALLNRAVFWFHPLAWWLEHRLAALAEEACDVAVLAAGHAPQDYSEYLLDLARSAMRHGKRESVVGMAMPGRYLANRIVQILDGVPLQPISRTRMACTVALCTISSVVFAAATLAPQQVQPLAVKAAIVPQTFTLPATSEPAPLTVQLQSWPAFSLPLQAEANGASPSGPLELALVSQNPRERTAEDLQSAYFNLARLRLQQLQPVSVAAGPPWLPNPALLAGLGLTDDQKTKIEKVLESHRQNVASSKERLDKEEAQLARLLEADPIEPGAVLAQSDRVIQARGELERMSGAMTLEVRQYLTGPQWMQWQATPLKSFFVLGRTF